MLGNLTGITKPNASEAINKKLQDEINELKTELSTLENEVDALSDNVDTNVIDANTGNINNVNATSVSSTSVTATNVAATNGTFDNLTVNGTVDNLNVTDADIQNVTADDVDTNTLEADQATINQLTGNTATIANLTVTKLKADEVDIGTITDDVNSENVYAENLAAVNGSIDNVLAEDVKALTATIPTLGSTTVNSNTVNTTDLNTTNLSAEDIDTLRVDASRMTSGIFSLNKNFYININSNVNDLGIIKMPAFDGVARLSFVSSSEVEQLTMTIINNEVEKKQILVNFSQKAGRLNGFAISANNELLIGVNGGSIAKMYYTFDTSEEFNAVPEQLPITEFPNDIQYSWLATSELGKTLCFIEPSTPTQGFEVTGMFKAASLEWTSVSIDNLDVVYDLTVRNDAYVGNDFHLKTFDVTAAPVTFEEVCGINSEGTIIDNSATVESYERLPIKMSQYTGNFKTTEIITINEDSVYYSLPGVIKGCIETPRGTFAAAGAVGATGTSILIQPIATCYAFDKTNLTQSTATFSLLMLDDSIVVDNRLTSLDGVYAYTGFSTKDSLIIAENIDEFFGFTEQDLVANGTITIQNVEYKRYDFTIDKWAGDLNNVYYYPINATEANMEKGIKITDTRYPDEKVDLVNVKAEDAYTADYATKALQDNNGDQIDTTYQKISEKAQPNGYASLDENGRIPYSQLPESAVEFKGTWDASTNNPTLPTGSDIKGDMYIVNVAGTQFGIDWYVGDQAIYDGTTYQRISGSEVGVDTVNGLKDAVTIANSTVNGQTITVDKVQGQTVYPSTVTNLISNTPVGETRVGYLNGTLTIAAGEELPGTWTIVCQKYDSTHYALTAVNTSNGRTFTRGYGESYWHEKKGFFYKNYYFTTDYSSAVGIGFQTTSVAGNHDICVSGYITKVTPSSYIRVPFKAFVRGNAATIHVVNVEVGKDVSSWCKFAHQASDNTIRFAIVCKPSAVYTRFTFEIDTVMIGDVGSANYADAPTQTITNATALAIWNGTQYTAITPTVNEMQTSTLTLAQYNALGTKTAGTLYLITG